MQQRDIDKFKSSKVFPIKSRTSLTKEFIYDLLLPQYNRIIRTQQFFRSPFSNDSEFNVAQLYGTGQYGAVFALEFRKKNSGRKARSIAVKVGPVYNDWNTAIEKIQIQNTLAKVEMAPVVYSLQYVEAGPASKILNIDMYALTYMDRIRGEVIDFLYKAPAYRFEPAFKCLLDKKYVLNLLHGDCHYGNIVILKDGKTLGFIDFDFSGFLDPQDKDVAITDFVPMIASFKEIKDKSTKELCNYLIKYYKDTFNIDIKEQYLVTKKHGGYQYAEGRADLNSYAFMSSSKTKAAIAEQKKILQTLFPNLVYPFQ